MRFAIKDNIRITAELSKSGDLATCICCGNKVRAYIKDTKNVSHWQHINKQICDNWYERETQWHIDWKNRFPLSWQEVVMTDEETGERHIADIYTIDREKKIVIEFQNSPMSGPELQSREKFYMDMIWVVSAESFNITIDREKEIQTNYTREILRNLSLLRQVIYDFYNEYSGEASSYKSGKVPFEHIILNKCIGVIESELRIGHILPNEVFDLDFERFKSAVARYIELEEKLKLEYKIKKDNGFVAFEWKRPRAIWLNAKAPVFFDFDGKLYLLFKEQNHHFDLQLDPSFDFNDIDDLDRPFDQVNKSYLGVFKEIEPQIFVNKYGIQSK